jgi:tRNA(Ile)-lysidine synthase
LAGSPAIDTVPDPARVNRFAADCAALWEGARQGDGRLGIAVSGGPDSLALLLLAHAAFPGRVEAATVDHGLRAESADEARFVAAVCADLGIDHATLPVELAPGNLQNEARSARYKALLLWARAHGLAALATAHHADDQAETLMMRLMRGSGVAGLAGVRARSIMADRETVLLRPLLGWRQAELEAVVRDAGLDPVRDPSNEDDRFDRARMRKALAEADWLDVDAVARSAGFLADAEQALAHMESVERQNQLTRIGRKYVYRPTGPRIIRQRVVGHVLDQLGQGARGSQIAALVERLEQGQPGNLAGVMARVVDRAWRFEAEPPRQLR